MLSRPGAIQFLEPSHEPIGVARRLGSPFSDRGSRFFQPGPFLDQQFGLHLAAPEQTGDC